MTSRSVVRFGQRMGVFAGLSMLANGASGHEWPLIVLGAAIVAFFVEVRGPFIPPHSERPIERDEP